MRNAPIFASVPTSKRAGARLANKASTTICAALSDVVPQDQLDSSIDLLIEALKRHNQP